MTGSMPQALLAATLLAACGAAGSDGGNENSGAERTGPLMRPGWNCLSCHREGSDTGAPVWTAGGTVYPHAESAPDEGLGGVTVILTDAGDHEIRLLTNEVGNFWTAEPLEAPFTVALEYEGRRIEMPEPPPAGSCNACHAQPPLADAPGRIYAP